MHDKDFFEQKKHQWFLPASQWPESLSIQKQLIHSLNENGLFVIKATARQESTQLKSQFKGYATQFGTALNQSAEGCDVFEVKDEGFLPGHPKFRGPSSNKQLSFHTDRCDIIVFYCVRPAENGGVNQFVRAQNIYNIFKRDHPVLLDVLEQKFIYKKHNVDEGNTNSTYELPVFDHAESNLSVSLMTYLIEKAANDPTLPDLTSTQKQALDKLQEICRRPENQLELKLEAGDMLFLNNITMLHSRTAFQDVKHQRLYYRIWLSAPFSQTLPESFRVLFGDTQAGSLRGGFKRLD
jgi:hypothetical protein